MLDTKPPGTKKSMTTTMRFILAVACVGALSGCTDLLQFEGDQCQTTDDCRALGPAGANTVCSPDRVCVVQPDGGGSTCTTNQECIDRNGGQPFVCRSDACFAMLSEDCTQVGGDFEDDHAIVIGVLAPLTG